MQRAAIGSVFLCSVALLTTKTICFVDCLDIVQKLIPKNPVILEAGARFGNDTLRMSKLWPEATIHAFEPHPESFWKLYQEISKQKNNINIYALALSDAIGTITLYHCPTNVGASSVAEPTEIFKNRWPFEKKPMHVACTTLDEWAKQKGITHVDFMWLDMEGHELAALKAGEKLLKTVKALSMEVNYMQLREGMPLYEEIKAWLEQRGFVELWRSIFPNKWQGDALFVRRECIPPDCKRKLLQLSYVVKKNNKES